jgi:cell shape-determining protein MreD
MRTGVLIVVAYAVLLVVGAVWRWTPLPRAMPDLAALFAVYLGLTARAQLAPSMLAAVVIGYLADLLMGTPRGALALDAAIVCLFAYVAHSRLLVRGLLFTVVFAALAGLVSGCVLIAIRTYLGIGPGGVVDELVMLAQTAALSGIAGPLVFRLCRAVDVRFARTQRERLAALEGLP